MPDDPEPLPELPRFTIWCEGYKNDKKQGTAYRVGSLLAKDFPTACASWARYHPAFGRNYNPKRNTYWGCRLFPTEAEARKSHG